MDATILSLFNVLLDSEKVINDERKKFSEVKSKIQELNVLISKQKIESQDCDERISKMVQTLASGSISVDETRYKEEFYQYKRETLQTAINTMKSKLSDLENSVASESTGFVEDVGKFQSTCGLGKVKDSAVSTNAKKQSLDLIVVKEQLEKDLNELNYTKDSLHGLLNRKSILTEQASELDAQLKVVQDEIREEELKIAQLKKKTNDLLNEEDVNPEFLTLYEDLKTYNSIELERKGKQLQQDLDHLQTLLSRKQGQQQKQQFILWQRRRRAQLLQDKKQSDEKPKV